MNWKDEVVEKLRRYSSMTSAVCSIPLELKNLEQEACTIQSAQAGRCGGRSLHAREQRLMNILVKQQELEILLTNTKSWLYIIDRAMEKLEVWDRRVLELLYIQQNSTAQVCKELGMERSSLYRMRDLALKNLTLYMYGALET